MRRLDQFIQSTLLLLISISTLLILKHLNSLLPLEIASNISYQLIFQSPTLSQNTMSARITGKRVGSTGFGLMGK